MTIDKALEILESYYREVDIDPPFHFNDALKLGIEALKRIRDDRAINIIDVQQPLPGEEV